MLRFFLILTLFLLCRCASKHQPVPFEPYFAEQPEELLSTQQLWETTQLESKADLHVLEKKRLYDLYLIEQKNLKKTAQRSEKLESLLEKLKPDVDGLFIQRNSSESVDGEKKKSEKEKVRFSNSELQQRYQQAYQLWNQDENERAFDLINELTQSNPFRDLKSASERIRILNLQFRIAFDLRDLEKTKMAFEKLASESECNREISQAGFLLSLFEFGGGQRKEAHDRLLNLCTEDNQMANQMRRVYWLFRTAEPSSSEQRKYYQELSEFPVQGYYQYLADLHLDEDFYLSNPEVFSLGEFKAPSLSAELISQAEERLRFGLKKDAVKLLLMAKEGLLENTESYLKALLYTARLLQAAGNHLEAMRIINLLLTGEGAPDERPVRSPWVLAEFMNLYHRPFQAQVEGLSRAWGVDPDFVYSIMRQESAFNPGAVSVAGARGLMQLMPSLAKFLIEQWRMPHPDGKAYLLKGTENLKIATYHLNQLNRLAPHPALVAAAYNAGINRVSKWWRRSGHYPIDIFVELIPVNETRNYVKLVLRNLIYYRGLREDGKVPKTLFSLELPPAPSNKLANTFGIQR